MDKTIEQLPPNVSYKTFDNLISYLQEDMPDRVDMSYLGYVESSVSERIRMVVALMLKIDPPIILNYLFWQITRKRKVRGCVK
jgi:hypothetical protein